MQNVKCKVKIAPSVYKSGKIVPAEFINIIVEVDVIPVIGEMSAKQIKFAIPDSQLRRAG